MKSRNDIHKDLLEREALDSAIRLARKKKKLTRDILSLMNGDVVERRENEKPDIVKRIVPKEGPDSDGCFIGIEHFLVEQVSRTEKSTRVSIVKEKKKYINKLIESFDENNKNTDEILEINRKLSNAIYDIAVSANTTGIEDLRQSFYTVFGSHLDRITNYRQNMLELTVGKPFKLALLIEFCCNADDIFCNNGKTVCRRTSGIYPVMKWMIDEFEKIDPAKLDYIVLYMKNSVDDEKEDVLALETKDIWGSLRKQGVIVYEYCDDPSRISFTKELSERGVEYVADVENKETYARDIIPPLRQAYRYKRDGVAFIASRAVQAFMFAYGKASFKGNDQNTQVISQFSREETLKRFEMFTAKYPV